MAGQRAAPSQGSRGRGRQQAGAGADTYLGLRHGGGRVVRPAPARQPVPLRALRLRLGLGQLRAGPSPARGAPARSACPCPVPGSEGDPPRIRSAEWSNPVPCPGPSSAGLPPTALRSPRRGARLQSCGSWPVRVPGRGGLRRHMLVRRHRHRLHIRARKSPARSPERPTPARTPRVDRQPSEAQDNSPGAARCRRRRRQESGVRRQPRSLQSVLPLDLFSW